MAKLSEGGRRCELLWAGRWRGGRSQQHGGSLPASKLPPARTVGALTDCADGRRTLGGRGALRKGRVPAHWPSGFSSWLPSTSGRRRKSKHGCVSYIDPAHRPVEPSSMWYESEHSLSWMSDPSWSGQSARVLLVSTSVPPPSCRLHSHHQ